MAIHRYSNLKEEKGKRVIWIYDLCLIFWGVKICAKYKVANKCLPLIRQSLCKKNRSVEESQKKKGVGLLDKCNYAKLKYNNL